MKLSQRSVKTLYTAEAGRILWDSELKGFGMKRTLDGVSFFLNYRTVHGKQRRCTIGRSPEWTVEAARAEAGELKRKIDKGRTDQKEAFDPLEEKDKILSEPTMAELAAEYLKTREDKSASTKRNDAAAIAHIILPELGKKHLATITSHDVEKIKAKLRATPYRANRVLALLSHMFSRAILWKWMSGENPARQEAVERYHEDPRECWLKEDELGRLEEALDKYPDQGAANAIRLIVLTGSRKGEVLQARWEEFDFDRDPVVWRKPSLHTKQIKTEYLPLSEAAIRLLRGMKPEIASGPVFHGRNGNAARVSLRKPWMQVCRAAGLATATIVEKKGRKITKWVPKARIHDLRHTFASTLVNQGKSLKIVGALIGHTQSKTTERYVHVAPSPLQEATNSFGKVFDRAKGLQVVPSQKDARKRAAGE